ncbi:MAG TPA: hypothetical protein P5044_01680 [bacterium]|nr:hypothetical protein [bacterium]
MKKIIFAVFSVLLMAACSNTTNSSNDGNTLPDTDEINDEQSDLSNDEAADNTPDEDLSDEVLTESDETADETTDEITDEEIPDDPGAIDRGEPVHGRVILQSYPESDKNSAWISANFYDKPMRLDAFSPFQPSIQKLGLKKGACSIFIADINAACNPQCGNDEFCNAESKCEKFSVSQSAGKITVSDTDAEVSMDYSPDEWFPGYYQTEFPADGLYSQAVITASAAGETLPAFTMSVKAPKYSDITVGDNGTVNLYDDKNTEIKWTPDGNDNAEMLLIINFGWHGAPPEATIICSAKDSAGKIVIDKDISVLAPLAGGPSLFPHGSYLFKMTSVRKVIDGKNIELWAAFVYGANPVHE